MRLLALVLITASTTLAQSPGPDTLFVHGDILTGAHLASAAKRDPFKSNPDQLLHTRVLRTIVNGETVYHAD